jgi:hypothetical protein
MSFRWNPQFSSEQEAEDPPSIWFFLALYVIVQGFALTMVVPGLPKGSIPWDKFIHDAVAVPFFCWMALSCFVWLLAYDMPATHAAAHNTARWNEITGWQQQNRTGMAVLDSVILTPEPDLAERMLKLEGSPPENPGKVMALGSIEAADDGSRLHGLLEALLTPLAARLAQAVKAGSFEIVMQCDHEELSSEVLAVWSKLELPGKPVVRWLDNSRDVGFADMWFETDAAPYGRYTHDRIPKYRLLLAWHLNKVGPDAVQTDSEAAVALLLGSPALMHEKPELKRQAWLLRQITGDADRADSLLASLLKAEQVPSERIHHLWHSGLKGLTQHATLGAVRESGLKAEEHAIDPAIGPQAPVARWLLQALAAKMAHFGQGAQLVALPHERGVALNVVAKEPDRVAVPWKKEYDYHPILGPELGGCASIWAVAMLLSPKGWSTADTVITWGTAIAMVVLFLLRHPGPVARAAESTVDFVASIIG